MENGARLLVATLIAAAPVAVAFAHPGSARPATANPYDECVHPQVNTDNVPTAGPLKWPLCGGD